jgi:LuxR family maltose regulon positive regulatory protein
MGPKCCSPAGLEKTTLLAEWASAARSAGRRVAWLSLDPQDNAAATFWAYVAASVHRTVPEARARLS